MPLSLQLATIEARSAQFSAPTSWPANSAFFRVRATGLLQDRAHRRQVYRASFFVGFVV